jgi:ribokinase
MIGTGGIGSGIFFALEGDHTLGREESRSGRFLDRRDYCKLHIVSHYVQVLLGPEFAVIPLGKVGADEIGNHLLDEMRQARLDVRYVAQVEGLPTLYSLCLIYPDGSGGNLTTDDSACAHVDPAFVTRAEPEFALFAGRGIALALPEVPLEARQEVLRLGTRYGFLRVASFTSGEMRLAADAGILRDVDLLAANLDEAASAAGVSIESREPEAIVDDTVQTMHQAYPHLQLSITAGSRGSWSWDGQVLAHVPAFPVPVVGTAGAGDAHLAGILVGLIAGRPLAQAQEAGALVAALAVTSPHTINKEMSSESLRAFASDMGVLPSAEVRSLLSALVTLAAQCQAV